MKLDLAVAIRRLRHLEVIMLHEVAVLALQKVWDVPKPWAHTIVTVVPWWPTVSWRYVTNPHDLPNWPYLIPYCHWE